MRSDDIAAVLDLIDRLGLTVADLTNHIHHQPTTPTFGEYIRVVRAAVSPTTAANYNTYWRLIEHHWSHRRIDQPTSTEIGQLVQQHRDHVVIRTNSRDGHAALPFRCAPGRPE